MILPFPGLGRWYYLWTSPLLCVLLTGCPSKPPPMPKLVAGQVKCNDKGVRNCSVTFWPRGVKNSKDPIVKNCTPDGSFSLNCFPGVYRVTIAPVSQEQFDLNKAGLNLPPGKTLADVSVAPSVIPKEFNDPESTPFEAIVTEEGNSSVFLDISSYVKEGK